jgi:DNA polymerase III epsilon subunit-like protein
MAYKQVYSRHHPGKFGLCIDWETSGADFGKDSSVDHQGIAFGAIVFDLTTLQEVESLYREIKFDDTKYKWTEQAEKIHGLSREHLAEHGVDRETALADLIEMMIKYWPPGFFATAGNEPDSKILLAGHNKGFDMDFTAQLFRDNDMEIVFHHVGMDSTMIAFAVSGEYKSDIVFEIFAGVIKRERHDALQDSRAALTVMRNIREIFQNGLA